MSILHDKTTAGNVSVDEIKPQADGRWSFIVTSLTNIGPESLTGKHSPCPKCGGTDRFRVYDDFENTGGGVCSQCFPKKNRDGFALVQWANDWTFPETLANVADVLGVKPTKRVSKAERNEVYRAFLNTLTLADEHHANLEARGLDAKHIDRIGCRTMPKNGRRGRVAEMVRKFNREAVLSVPGFVSRSRDGNDYLTFAGSDGMIIPVRDDRGRITGLRIRRESSKTGPKYVWASSSRDGGPSPGAQLHFPQAVPITDTVRITEGELKAEVATIKTGIPTISLPGVQSWRKAFDWIKERGIRSVRIAFDADAKTNPAVGNALAELYTALIKVGVSVEIETWNQSDGKGIDDCLISGGPITCLQADDAAAWVANLPKIAPTGIKSDTGVAEAVDDPHRLARLWLKGRNVVHYRDDVYVYEEPCYRVVTDGELRAEVVKLAKSEFDIDAMEREQANEEDAVAKKPTKHLVSNVVECIKAIAFVSPRKDMPFWLDRDPSDDQYIGLRNGVLDVAAFMAGKSNVLTSCSPDWFSTVTLPFAYDPKAECPTWYAFLERNLEADAERINILQEWFGLCLVFDTSFQKFLMLIGEGSNGKSVVCAVIEALLGDDNVSNVPLEMMGGRFQLFSTLGKLANVTPEIGELDKVAEGQLKAFTSGDQMQFERKRRDPVSAMPTARMILATNNLPRFTDRSDGLWRRMLQMPFRVKIEDHEKVRGMDKPDWWQRSGELPGIFNWSIEGLRRLKRQGQFTESKLCKEAVRDHKRESNPAGDFLTSHYTESNNPDAHIVTADAYGKYREWCEANGFYALNSTHFGREIVRQFPKAESAQINRKRGYRGIWESQPT